MKKPVALVILDGVGVAPAGPSNAVTLANTPNIDKWIKKYPNILMHASGEPVGLPDGQMGNSEVGHMNIGAGRIVYQSLALMNKDIREGGLANNEVVAKTIAHAKENNSKVNILGLVSDGGVHSHIDHIIGLANFLKEQDVEYVLHAFTDGRDVDQKSAKRYFEVIENHNIPVSSISGRYYSMDRDQKWHRTQLAYDVIADRKGNSFSNINEWIENEYSEERVDEFFIPAFNPKLKPVKSNDSIIFINFRPDRARMISHLLVGSNTDLTNYEATPKQGRLDNLYFASAREYVGIEQDIMYPPERMTNLIGEVIENNGVKQVRAAETEKYPHVTFFMDGGQEIAKEHETRILVESPKVATYDLDPEMSCRLLTEKIIENADGQEVFLINFAQPDMVGHTGSIEAVVKSIEVADEMLLKLYNKIVVEMGGVMLITADHGNADRMINKDGSVCTTHTTNPVRLIITDKNAEFKEEFTDSNNIKAKLGDLAPIVLKYAGIEKPTEMTGEILIK